MMLLITMMGIMATNGDDDLRANMTVSKMMIMLMMMTMTMTTMS